MGNSMAKDLSDTVRDALGHAAREAVKNVGDMKPKAKKSSGPFSGARGLAAGAGLAAAAPLAKKGFDTIRGGNMPSPSPKRAAGKVASKAGDKVAGNVKDLVSDKVEQAGGVGGIAKDAASSLLPGGGGGGGTKNDMPRVGKGRRRPGPQSRGGAAGLETGYNQVPRFRGRPRILHPGTT